MADNARAKSDSQILQDRTETVMNIINERCSYYRANPHRFVEEYLGIPIKLFQKMLLWAMMFFDNFYFLAARSLGKTYLVAVFAVTRAILYPGSKIVVCSYTFKQGKEIVSKIIDELMPRSPMLRSEILKINTGKDDCSVLFRDGSCIKVVTARDSARGGRSHVLIIDESRLVPLKIVDKVLKPFNGTPRMPGYTSKPEYAQVLEMNKEINMSSAYYSASEMYSKIKAYVANMLDPSLKYFICDLPYMLSIKEGLLMRQQIENEMSEQTFNEFDFMMERMGIFVGESEDALFDFNVLKDRRILKDALKPLEYYRMNSLKVPDKKKGEIRVLSLDVALMSSRRRSNDASAFVIHSAIPTPSHNYMDNIVFIDTYEGVVTDDLGLLTMRYFYQYGCDYVVVDGKGVGIPIMDFIMADRYDAEYGQLYPALNCMNNPDFSERCKVKGAPKKIFVIVATPKMNNDMCLSLRAGFQNGYINLLMDEDIIEDEVLPNVKHYSRLTDAMRAKVRLPYVQTTLLINELVNLQHETVNGLIRVKEKASIRKDRYSSVEYGYHFIQELSKSLKPEKDSSRLADKFIIRKPKLLHQTGGAYG